MAMATSSTFTANDRRKRIATYGKQTRTAKNFTWNEDAPSPERPRKQAGQTNGSLKRPGTGFGGTGRLGNTHISPIKSPASHDVFDVPSDDDGAAPSPPPVNKPIAKPIAPRDDFDVPSSGDEEPVRRLRTGKTPQPLRKPESTRQIIPQAKTSRKPEEINIPPIDNTSPPPRRRAKTPRLGTTVGGPEEVKEQATKRPDAKQKARSRATTPAPPTQAAQKKVKNVKLLPSKKPAVKQLPELDVFDVPLSDEDTPIWTPRRSKPAPLPRAKTPVTTRASSAQPSLGGGDSDDSNASRKRKRQESSQSAVVIKDTDVTSKRREGSIPQRSKKYQKKEDSISPGHEANGFVEPAKTFKNDSIDPPIKQPKRTRVRTAPSSTRGPIIKGQSSPAKLHGMLAVRSFPKPSPVAEVPEPTPLEDETMYDIQGPVTPMVRSIKATTVGLVTPRQKQIFNSLLEDSTDMTTPGMPSIRRLQLTDRKPEGSLVAGLARSSSDIPQSAYARKTRLIDTLRQAVTSSEEEDTESDEESGQDVVEDHSKPLAAPKPNMSYVPSEMDIDSEPPAQSQSSQNTYTMNAGSKVTYAKQRSYLEESNLEDGLLLSMDLDEMLGLGGPSSRKRQDSVSDDEDDPASQVRGIHELRMQGQNQKFQMEAQTAIDDIADKARLGNSMRRTAMLDFCTRLMDKQFLEQLLESALSHQLLGSLSSKGEIIFDFGASVAVALILNTAPGPSLLDEIMGSNILTTLAKLLECESDISRIAKERKTNLSKVGREDVDKFRALVWESTLWPSERPDKVSPQIAALKVLELLTISLRSNGNTDAIVPEPIICKLVELATPPCERLRAGNQTSQDLMTIDLVFSILEATSTSKEKQATWPSDILERLADIIPVLLDARASSIILAIRVCVQLTNNKPKVCETFAGPTFIQSLVRFITHSFARLSSGLQDEQGTEVLDALILGLGAMINLTEFSNQARASVVTDGDELLNALAKTFLEGSERAARVCTHSHFLTW